MVSVIFALTMYYLWLNKGYEIRDSHYNKEIPVILQSLQGKVNDCAIEKLIKDIEFLKY